MVITGAVCVCVYERVYACIRECVHACKCDREWGTEKGVQYKFTS